MPTRPARYGSISRFDTLVSLALLGSMLAVAIIVALHFHRTGRPLVLSVIGGAFVGVLGVWFVARYTWMAAMCVFRGAPFRAGDRVQITSGEHRGSVGEVIDRVPDRCAVIVTLSDKTGTAIVRIFDWNEVRRTTKATNVAI